MLNLEIVDKKTGEKTDFATLFARYLLKYVLSALFLFDYWFWVVLREPLHDWIMNTEVVWVD